VTAKTERILRGLFYAYVAATFLHIACVVYYEPFAFDAWNVAVDSDAQPATAGRFFTFWYEQYTTSNPRIGQPLAYLAYKVLGVAELGTPLAYLAIVLACFVIGAGRWPSRNSGRDLATLTIGIGFLWFAAPNLPAYMFCRAYATNYVWAAALQLWLVAVLRLHPHAAPASRRKLVGIAVLGVAAGMCNEHTGPTLLLAIVAYVAWTWRVHRVRSLPSQLAALAVLVGYAIVFFAPGQGQRYEGLGEKMSLVQQVLVRGFSGNLDILQGFFYAAAPLLVVLVCVVALGNLDGRQAEHELAEWRSRQRGALVVAGLALVAGLLITMTIFASPKLGPRFYMHAMMILLAGVMAVIRAFLRSPRAFAPLVIVAVLASIYAGARTIPSYRRHYQDSRDRLAELAATPPGGVYSAAAWSQVNETWWFLGDDFRDQKKRQMVAKYFGLDRVLLRSSDLWATLGVSDVKLTMQYDFEPALCVDEISTFDMQPYIGRDVAAIHHQFLDTIVAIQRSVSAQLRTMDLVVTFRGPQPPLPRPRTYVGRWRDGAFEGYGALLSRMGRSLDRTITVGGELGSRDWDMYIVALGDPPRLLGKSSAGRFTYRPWRTAQYWVMACDADACFVTLAMHHRI
jgi:hypothetical protein